MQNVHFSSVIIKRTGSIRTRRGKENGSRKMADDFVYKKAPSPPTPVPINHSQCIVNGLDAVDVADDDLRRTTATMRGIVR